MIDNTQAILFLQIAMLKEKWNTEYRSISYFQIVGRGMYVWTKRGFLIFFKCRSLAVSNPNDLSNLIHIKSGKSSHNADCGFPFFDLSIFSRSIKQLLKDVPFIETRCIYVKFSSFCHRVGWFDTNLTIQWKLTKELKKQRNLEASKKWQQNKNNSKQMMKIYGCFAVIVLVAIGLDNGIQYYSLLYFSFWAGWYR